MPAQDLGSEIKKRSTWSIVMGVLIAILGVFLIAYPLATATITTMVVGWMLIFVGVAQFVHAFYSQSIGQFVLRALLGVLYGVTGIALAFYPFAGVAALTAFVGSMIFVYGVVAAVAAFQLRPVQGWGWVLVDAIASLLLGGLILAKWPSSSLWAIGTLVGVSVLMGGISRIMLGGAVRRGIRRIDTTLPRAA